jgi:MFS family permease
LLGALYPGFWGIAQLGTGALSDRIGRKWVISAGTLIQAGAALALVAASTSYGPWIVAAVVLGLGTAMVYPTLLAAVGDVAHPGESTTCAAIGASDIMRCGGPERSASTGTGAIAGSLWAHCSQV